MSMSPATWIIVGATRGIGLEMVRQLLHRGERVIATVRSTTKASQLWTLSAGAAAPRLGAWCRMLECDVTVDESINVCFCPSSLFPTCRSVCLLRESEIIFYRGYKISSALLNFFRCKLSRIYCRIFIILIV